MMHLERIPASWRLLALLAVGALVLTSCLPFGQQEEKPLIPLKDEKVVVLPFKMPNSSYFESAVGARFSADIAHWIKIACPKATVADSTALPKGLVEEGIKAFKKDDIMEDSAVLLLGKRLEVDYLVAGEIHELRSKDPRALNVFRGTMVISARVADLRRGKVIWEIERKAFAYPPLLFGMEELPAEEKDEETVMRMTMMEAARNIAVIFGGRDKLFADQNR